MPKIKNIMIKYVWKEIMLNLKCQIMGNILWSGKILE